MYNPNSFIDLLSVLAHNSLLPVIMIVASYRMMSFVEKSDFALIGMNFYSGWFKNLRFGTAVGINGYRLICFYAVGWINIIGCSWEVNGLSEYLYGGFYIIVSLVS